MGALLHDLQSVYQQNTGAEIHLEPTQLITHAALIIAESVNKML